MQQPRRPRLSDLTPAELRARAVEVHRLAEHASTSDVRDALERLARRYECLARNREQDTD